MIYLIDRTRWLLIPSLLAGLCMAVPGRAAAQGATAPPPAAAPPPKGQLPEAAAPDAPPSETADSLLKRVDQQLNAFKDATFEFKLRIKEPSGEVSEIEFSTLQKGNKRLVRFLSPANLKGMGILVESADTMYALLPAYGNRVRRIGAHQMNQSFMGSDVNSDDMALVEFFPSYQPKLVATENGQAVLELTARPGKQAAFPRVKMWVEHKRALISRIEYMDQSGKRLRTQRREDYRQDNPPGTPAHYSPGKMVFVDEVRNKHESELLLLKSQINTGLSDDVFTVRSLTRG